jgi:hypothetical protein
MIAEASSLARVRDLEAQGKTILAQLPRPAPSKGPLWGARAMQPSEIAWGGLEMRLNSH